MNKIQLFRYITAFVFILFAYVQFNDPDSLIWIMAYLLVAGQSVISNKLYYKTWMDNLLIFVFLVCFITYIPSLVEWVQDGLPSIVSDMNATNMYIEYVRESLGLLLCILSLTHWRKRQ